MGRRLDQAARSAGVRATLRLKAVVILHGKAAEGRGDADSRCAADPHLADRREHRFAGILHFMHDFVGQASLVEQGEMVLSQDPASGTPGGEAGRSIKVMVDSPRAPCASSSFGARRSQVPR